MSVDERHHPLARRSCSAWAKWWWCCLPKVDKYADPETPLARYVPRPGLAVVRAKVEDSARFSLQAGSYAMAASPYGVTNDAERRVDPILFEVIRNALVEGDRGDVGLPATHRVLHQRQDPASTIPPPSWTRRGAWWLRRSASRPT